MADDRELDRPRLYVLDDFRLLAELTAGENADLELSARFLFQKLRELLCSDIEMTIDRTAMRKSECLRMGLRRHCEPRRKHQRNDNPAAEAANCFTPHDWFLHLWPCFFVRVHFEFDILR